MALSIRPSHLARYTEIARVLWRHGDRDLFRNAGMEEVFRDAPAPSEADADLTDLADDLRELGPTFVKLGQLLSSRVRSIDEERVLAGLEKIANRIAAGTVIASLILGAALLMRVETDASVFGYPAFGFFFFLVAAAGGLGLVISVLRDRS